MKNPDLLLAIKPVVNAFEQLSIPYYIGGSIASSVYGIARATMDVDIIADLSLDQTPSLVRLLRDQYYVEESMINNAITHVSSFNLIHLETMMKVDVFVQKRDAYHQAALARKVEDRLAEDDRDSVFYLSSPEDIILSKLSWYEAGGKVSERQWLDVLGVMKVQSDSLDQAYLAKWADTLGMSHLLRRALTEAGILP